MEVSGKGWLRIILYNKVNNRLTCRILPVAKDRRKNNSFRKQARNKLLPR